MRKRDELTDPAACMVRARDDEMTFVLLGRDAAAPVAIRAWIAERIRLGKNLPNDPQLVEAELCAQTMEEERIAAVRKAAGTDPEPGPAVRYPDDDTLATEGRTDER